MEEHERAPLPDEATEIVDKVAEVLRNSGMDVRSTNSNLHLYAAYRPKHIETGYEPDLTLWFNQRGHDGKDVRVELDLRIHNPR
jgi:hypothetical protein